MATLTNAKTSETITVTMSDADAALTLGKSTEPFCLDLAAKFLRYGWSDAQRFYAHKNANAIRFGGTATVGTPRPPASVPSAVAARAARPAGPTPEAFAMFETALSNGLRHPRVTFVIEQTTFVLSLAGDRAKFPGTLNVTDNGRYPDNRFFGRVMRDGQFSPGRDVSPVAVAFITRFIADPDAAVREYGRRTGVCCYCHAPLTTAKRTNGRALYAVDLGYGKACGAKWGRPWGLEAADARAAVKK